ncbi:MAG: replication-relaxation family protein [Pseudonocardiaceae bacterium]
MTAGGAIPPMPARVRPAHVEWVAARLTARDREILKVVNRLRVVSSAHLSRLFFHDLREGRSRTTARTRTLRRLVAWRVLCPLERRTGGHAGGSAVQCYALDSAGQLLIAAWQQAEGAGVRVRRPGAPGERTLRHILGVTDLYVSLVELGRVEGFTVTTFEAEPGSWWPHGLGGQLKPDAYTLLTRDQVRDHWWIEHDQATEGLPTIRRKIETYVDFLRRGQLGPGGVVPRVLISTITDQRRMAIEALVRRLPPLAAELMRVTHTERAAQAMYEVLRE